MKIKNILKFILISVSSLIIISTFLILIYQYFKSTTVVPKCIKLQQLALFYEEYPNLFLSRITKALFITQNLYEVNFEGVLVVIISIISSLKFYEILAFVAYLVLIFFSIFNEEKVHKRRIKRIDAIFTVFIMMNVVLAILTFFSMFYLELDPYVALNYGRYVVYIGCALMSLLILFLFILPTLKRLFTKFRVSYE